MLILVISVILLGFLFYRPNQDKCPVSNFIHTHPKKRYPDLVKEYGQPYYCVNKPHGVCIWRPKNTIYSKIMLKDEAIKHCHPKEHYDFLYSSVPINIPIDRLREVLQISKSITYDQLKRQLTVRCHFTGANKATIWMVVQLLAGNLDSKSTPEIQNMYGRTVLSTMKPGVGQKLEAEIAKLLPQINSKYDLVTREPKKC